MNDDIVIDDGEDFGSTYDETVQKESWEGKDLWENETVVWEHEGEYSTTLFSQRAQDIIEKHNPEQVTFLLVKISFVNRCLLECLV